MSTRETERKKHEQQIDENLFENLERATSLYERWRTRWHTTRDQSLERTERPILVSALFKEICRRG